MRGNENAPLQSAASYGIIFMFSTSRGQSLPGNANLRESPNDFPLNKAVLRHGGGSAGRGTYAVATRRAGTVVETAQILPRLRNVRRGGFRGMLREESPRGDPVQKMRRDTRVKRFGSSRHPSNLWRGRVLWATPSAGLWPIFSTAK